jgi:hypothetical protein
MLHFYAHISCHQKSLCDFFQLPISPVYDLALLAKLWFDLSRRKNLAKTPLGWLDGQCVQGAGTYSPLDFRNTFTFFRERFCDLRSVRKGALANQRLLGISASRGRVAALDPDWEWV